MLAWSPYMRATASPRSNPVLTNLHHCEPRKYLAPTNMGACFPMGGVAIEPLATLSVFPTTTCWAMWPLCTTWGQFIVNVLKGMPVKSKKYAKTHEMRFCSISSIFLGFRGLCQRGPCVAWDSGLQGFVGAMRCMGLTHA